MKKFKIIPQHRKSLVFDEITSDEVTFDDIWNKEKTSALPGEEVMILELVSGESRLYKNEGC